MQEKKLKKRLDSLGWGLFFVWLGIYFALGLQKNGIFALGLGIIILFENALRIYWGLSISKFWIAMGGLFFISGFLGLFNLGIFPFILIFCGAYILYRYTLPQETHEEIEKRPEEPS